MIGDLFFENDVKAGFDYDAQIQLLPKDGIQTINDDYYKSVDYKEEKTVIRRDSGQYPRHPVNTQTRTSFNDVYLQVYFKKAKGVAFSPSFEQDYELEFFTGSKKGKEKYPNLNEYSSFDITIVSQASLFFHFFSHL